LPFARWPILVFARRKPGEEWSDVCEGRGLVIYPVYLRREPPDSPEAYVAEAEGFLVVKTEDVLWGVDFARDLAGLFGILDEMMGGEFPGVFSKPGESARKGLLKMVVWGEAPREVDLAAILAGQAGRRSRATPLSRLGVRMAPTEENVRKIAEFVDDRVRAYEAARTGKRYSERWPDFTVGDAWSAAKMLARMALDFALQDDESLVRVWEAVSETVPHVSPETRGLLMGIKLASEVLREARLEEEGRLSPLWKQTTDREERKIAAALELLEESGEAGETVEA